MWDNNAWTLFYDNGTDGEPPFLTQDPCLTLGKEEASERGPEGPLNPHLVYMRAIHFLPLGVNSTDSGPSQSVSLMPSSGPDP